MKILAISGSVRASSTNTAALREIARCAPTSIEISLYNGLGQLPIFNPDLEGDATPPEVRALAQEIANADALLFSSPEYIHAIPGGLKNAIDWMVSRDEFVGKPVYMIHTSHRGEDLLSSLRLVLGTVSERFNPDIFLRFHFISKTEDEISSHMRQADTVDEVRAFLEEILNEVNLG